MKKYVTIDEQKGKQLEISVYYSLGGYNNFYGKQERRGIYVSLQPCFVTKHPGGYVSVQCVPMDGRKMLLQELKRANAKKLQVWEEAVSAIVEKIGEAYKNHNFNEVVALLTSIAA